MHRIQIAFAAAAFAAASVTPAWADSAPTASVTITLNDVAANQGNLYVSLQKRDDFMQPRSSYGKIIKAPAAGKNTVTLEGVAAGEYSISVWHDINANMKFDKAADGMPLDGWSMIGARQMHAQPKWEDVKFSVTTSNATVALDMIYAK